MKKTLLSLAMAFGAIVAVNAQTVWNFSEAPYGASPTVSFASTFTENGLTVGTDGTALFSLTANTKTIDGTTYSYRLQTGGGGAPVSPSFIPTTRYLKFDVTGPTTINVGMISSNASAERTLVIVNTDESFVDSISHIVGSAAATYTYNYTGAATSLYLYSKSSGINYYYVSTGVYSGVNKVLTDKGVAYNGTEVTNSNNLPIEVYNVLGKRVASATTAISTANFQKGIYIVRVTGTKDVLKFSK